MRERDKRGEREKNLLLAKKDDTLKHAHACPIQIKKRSRKKQKKPPNVTKERERESSGKVEERNHGGLAIVMRFDP